MSIKDEHNEINKTHEKQQQHYCKTRHHGHIHNNNMIHCTVN